MRFERALEEAGGQGEVDELHLVEGLRRKEMLS